MASIEELRAERIKKLEALRALGETGYPEKSSRTHELVDIVKDFSTLEASQEVVIVAGRVMSSRGQGAICFIDVFDGTARFQVVIKLPESGDEVMKFYRDYVDTGDFVEITGTVFVTKSGQQSISEHSGCTEYQNPHFTHTHGSFVSSKNLRQPREQGF